MYVSPSKKRLYTIVTVVVLALIPVSVIGFLLYEDYRSQASPEERPVDVRMSDVTETSAVISWITPDKAVEGWLLYSDQSGVSDGSPLAQDDRDVRSGTIEQRTTHYVTLSNLQPDTTYYFVIGSGARTWKDQDKNEFTFDTAAVGSDTIPTPDPIYGSVTNGTGQNAIIYVTLQENGVKSSPVSALTNDSGNFEVDLAHIREADLESKFSYTDDTEMIIFAQGGDVGGAVLRISVGSEEAISLTMAEDYPVTDIFAESAQLEVEEEGEEEEEEEETPTQPPSTTPTPTPPSTEEPVAEGEYPEGTPTTRHDVPLIALILGTSTSEVGISNILISNVTENSFTVVWNSAQQEVGSIFFGTDQGDLGTEARDGRDSIVQQGSYYTHNVSVGDLVPETTYYYEIHSGSDVYDSSGSPYEITLPATEDSPPEFYSIFGEVEGTGAQDSVIIGRIVGAAGTSAYISAPVQDDGTWTLSIGGVRTLDYEDYFNYTSEDTLQLTGRTKGNEVTEEYILGDVSDSVITIELDMILPETGETFERGLYAYLSNLANLPETALNRLTAFGVIIALLLIGVGSYLLIRAYSSERNLRWERDVLRNVEGE